jgi:RHH-type proline utilization regulon transcriptional repressor/proline dehydrogenase/delta 1-pyrroline-5-carboxylate dehydrogenase
VAQVQARLDRLAGMPVRALGAQDLPSPTGESNRLSVLGRGTVLCLGPTAEDAAEQARIARDNGCRALAVAPGVDANSGIDGCLARDDLSALRGVDVVALWSDTDDMRAARRALAGRDGALIGLACGPGDLAARCRLERHICIDTTAAGGNAALLAAESEAHAKATGA